MPARLAPIRRSLRCRFVVATLLALPGAIVACGGSDAAVTPPPAVGITVTPDTENVLTCEAATFTAKVTGSTDTKAAFSIDPSVGSIDETGKYTAPIQTPDPASVSIIATADADKTQSAKAKVTLATAFPGAAVPIAGSDGWSNSGPTGIYTHATASSGSRAYAVWTDDPDNATAVGLKLSRSDDGGATWSAGVDAFHAGVVAADAVVECPTVAIDPKNPDLVYALGEITDNNSFSQPIDDGSADGLDGDRTEVLAVSTDGGKTFKQYVVYIGASGGICPDVTAPAANAVMIVEAGLESCTAGQNVSRDVFMWFDANRGAGFATGAVGLGIDLPLSEYFAAGLERSLDTLKIGDMCSVAHVYIESDGGTDASGDATESARFFTDGAGRVCISYLGDVFPENGVMITKAYAQCSGDNGKTFGAGVELTDGTGTNPSSPFGALGANKAAAVVWTTGGPTDGALYIALSKDAGATFGKAAMIPTYTIPGDTAPAFAFNPTIGYDAAGILWLAYHANDNGNGDALVVDKSCDGGVTWSGGVPLESAGSDQMKWPSILLTPGDAPHVVASKMDHMNAFALTPAE